MTDACKAAKKYMNGGRKNSMPRKKVVKTARNEPEVLEKVSDWCKDRHPTVEIQKCEYEKLIESTAEKKVIDATVIGYYKHRSRSGAKGCLIAELEFEEHKQSKYSILEDMTEITALLRKLAYWRNDIPQYWLKIDKDGTPFMINYRYISDNRQNLKKMNPYGRYTSHEQTTRIIAAQRENTESKWPSYVIIGWDNIFKELHRVIKLAGF